MALHAKNRPGEYKRLRKLIGLTQGEAAERMGVTKEAYRRREVGAARCRPEHVYAMRYLYLEQHFDLNDVFE